MCPQQSAFYSYFISRVYFRDSKDCSGVKSTCFFCRGLWSSKFLAHTLRSSQPHETPVERFVVPFSDLYKHYTNMMLIQMSRHTYMKQQLINPKNMPHSPLPLPSQPLSCCWTQAPNPMYFCHSVTDLTSQNCWVTNLPAEMLPLWILLRTFPRPSPPGHPFLACLLLDCTLNPSRFLSLGCKSHHLELERHACWSHHLNSLLAPSGPLPLRFKPHHSEEVQFTSAWSDSWSDLVRYRSHKSKEQKPLLPQRQRQPSEGQFSTWSETAK